MTKTQMSLHRALDLPKLLQQAFNHHRQGRLLEADGLYATILEMEPSHFDALHMRGVLKQQQGNYPEAVRLIGAALKVNPNVPPALSNCAVALRSLKRNEEALASYDRALALQPDFADALNNRGATLQDLNRHDEALASYDRALAVKPDYPEALYNRGNALRKLDRREEAIASYDRALAINPNYVQALNDRGEVLTELNRHVAALQSFTRAVAIKPDYVQALNNHGNALQALKRYEDSLASYGCALALKPDFAEALNNRGNALSALRRYDEAIGDSERLLRLDPNHKYLRGKLLHSKMHCCLWDGFPETVAQIAADVQAGIQSVVPFDLFPVSDSPADQLRCSRDFVRRQYPPSPSPLWRGERYRHDRIRIAYLSADFHAHATAYLAARLFERHDRSRFETFGISFGPEIPSETRTRLKSAFEHFFDVRETSDRDVAKMLREFEIDIAVDLKGFTEHSRTGIFALRAAPIQVNYLGYPGTMGADYIDYIVADRIVIPEDQRRYYAEKVVYLPGSYQVNDSTRRIAERTPARSELGLPETGFIFCSLNNTYKITPSMFDLWMRLLKQVDGSVLWLLEGNTAAPANLRREAEKRGVAPERLIFAPYMKLEDHLARHRVANLFLDTLPCNAHTTASDALWAGLPIVTCFGTTFGGRVAGSLLHAAGLPELITTSLDEYEALALTLAKDPDALAAIKSKLARNRDTCPLFDTDRFRRHIENAYRAMWEWHQRGETPDHFSVESAS